MYQTAFPGPLLIGACSSNTVLNSRAPRHTPLVRTCMHKKRSCRRLASQVLSRVILLCGTPCLFLFRLITPSFISNLIGFTASVPLRATLETAVMWAVVWWHLARQFEVMIKFMVDVSPGAESVLCGQISCLSQATTLNVQLLADRCASSRHTFPITTRNK